MPLSGPSLDQATAATCFGMHPKDFLLQGGVCDGGGGSSSPNLDGPEIDKGLKTAPSLHATVPSLAALAKDPGPPESPAGLSLWDGRVLVAEFTAQSGWGWVDQGATQGLA